MTVWAASEVPHVLGTLGFVDIEAAYEDLGLEFHLVSMFILASFIVLRTSRILRVVGAKEKVELAAYEGMKKSLGVSGAAAARFYLDLSQARKNPTKFVVGLHKVFAAGAQVLEQKISEELVASGLAKAGEAADGKGLAQLLQAVQS